MKIKFIGRSVNISQDMVNEAEERLQCLDGYIDDSEQIKVSVYKAKKYLVVSIMMVFDGKLVKTERQGSDFVDLVSEAAEGIVERIEKLNDKRIKRVKDQSRALLEAGADDDGEYDEEGLIVKKKTIDLIPMTPKEAIAAMEELGHDTYIFPDVESGKICMIYARNDGKYGLIETN